MHESREASPADVATFLNGVLAGGEVDTLDSPWVPFGAPEKSPEHLPHPSGHRTRADHAKLKAKRKRGRKGRAS